MLESYSAYTGKMKNDTFRGRLSVSLKYKLNYYCGSAGVLVTSALLEAERNGL